jgi:hypothetical protein
MLARSRSLNFTDTKCHSRSARMTKVAKKETAVLQIALHLQWLRSLGDRRSPAFNVHR